MIIMEFRFQCYLEINSFQIFFAFYAYFELYKIFFIKFIHKYFVLLKKKLNYSIPILFEFCKNYLNSMNWVLNLFLY